MKRDDLDLYTESASRAIVYYFAIAALIALILEFVWFLVKDSIVVGDIIHVLIALVSIVLAGFLTISIFLSEISALLRR